jgi:hypothetical protein
MRQRLSGHLRAFLKCFFAIVVASSAVVLAISNFASAYRQGKQWVMWIAHFASGAGRPHVVLIALGLGVVGAAFISSHIHLRHKIPHAKNRLLGGGAVSLGLALLLAIDAHVGRPHTTGHNGSESAQPRIARVLPQPGNAEEEPAASPSRESTQGTSTQVDASDRDDAKQVAPTDASYQQTTSEPSTQEAVMSTYSPDYSEPSGQEEDGQAEQSESDESAPEESGAVSTASSSVEPSNAATSSTSASASATASATASIVVYSTSETASTSSNATTSEPHGTETSEPSGEGEAMEGGCSGE